MLNSDDSNKADLRYLLLKYRKVSKSTNCWLFTGPTDNNDYGRLWWAGKHHLVHRLSAHLYLNLKLEKTHILVLHKNECHNPNCFNPEHLYLGTKEDNGDDIVKYGNHNNSRKTHCPRGHEYSEENTLYLSNYISGKPKRQCRQCKTISDYKHKINTAIKKSTVDKYKKKLIKLGEFIT